MLKSFFVGRSVRSELSELCYLQRGRVIGTNRSGQTNVLEKSCLAAVVFFAASSIAFAGAIQQNA